MRINSLHFILYIGVRRGVVWVAGQLLASTNTGSKSSSPALSQTPEHKASVSFNYEKIFEKWLESLQQLQYDPNDLGQIRLQIILRIYSTICNHRNEVETFSDRITNLLGNTFSSLLERSPTVLNHLEVFPNYFLSGISESIGEKILKSCITIFLRRPSLLIIKLISFFNRSPYIQNYIQLLSDLYTRGDKETRIAVFNVCKRIDKDSFEKRCICDFINMLSDKDTVIRQSVYTLLVDLGTSHLSPLLFSLSFISSPYSLYFLHSKICDANFNYMIII